jgi:hypothetical protein
VLTKWGCSSRGGVLAPKSVASHGLRPHTVARPSHHRPLLLQPSSTASCSPNKYARPTLLLRPSLARSSGGSLLATLQAAHAPWRRQGSSLATTPPVASNGWCPHSHRLGGAPIDGDQAQDNSGDEGRGHRGYPQSLPLWLLCPCRPLRLLRFFPGLPVLDDRKVSSSPKPRGAKSICWLSGDSL